MAARSFDSPPTVHPFVRIMSNRHCAREEVGLQGFGGDVHSDGSGGSGRNSCGHVGAGSRRARAEVVRRPCQKDEGGSDEYVGDFR